MLCDCPGLVMPSFVSTKAEMVCNGILPIDQLRDSIAPIGYVCESMGRDLLERCYGVMIVRPGEGEDPSRSPTAHELLSSYACELTTTVLEYRVTPVQSHTRTPAQTHTRTVTHPHTCTATHPHTHVLTYSRYISCTMPY